MMNFQGLTDMEYKLEAKKVWLGEVAPGGGTYLEHINSVAEATGKVPKNAFIEILSNELQFTPETLEKE